MSVWRSARLLHIVLHAGASLGVFLFAGEAGPASKAIATPGYQSPEDTFYADIRPATPEQQLPKELEKKAEAQASYMQGLLLEEQGDYEDALAAYTRTLQLDPGGNPQLAVRIAHDYAKRGDVANGIDVLKDLAKIRPNEASAYLNLAYLYFKQLKKPELAVKYAEQAVQVDPKNLVGYETLFEIYLALNQKKDAQAILVKARKLDSKDPNFWISLADLTIQLYDIGQKSFPTSRFAEVDLLLKKAAGLAGDDGGVYAKIADDYVR